MAATAAADQHRGQKTACTAHEGQHRRILPDRQESAQGADHDHQRESHARGNQRNQFDGSKHRQIQHPYPAALQHQSVHGAALAQVPAGSQQDGSTEGSTGQAEFDRQQAVAGGVLEQEGYAEEEHDDAHAHHRVAAQQPVSRCIEGVLQQVRCGGRSGLGREGWRRFWLANRQRSGLLLVRGLRLRLSRGERDRRWRQGGGNGGTDLIVGAYFCRELHLDRRLRGRKVMR